MDDPVQRLNIKYSEERIIDTKPNDNQPNERKKNLKIISKHYFYRNVPRCLPFYSWWETRPELIHLYPVQNYRQRKLDNTKIIVTFVFVVLLLMLTITVFLDNN